MKEFILQIVREVREKYREFILLFRKPKYNAKVFCIGFNKTGTTSLGKSLSMMGYRNTTFNKKVWRKYYRNNEIVKILNYTAKFDSADDLPWLKEDMIPILDRVFPGSKFIYLTRDEEAWKKSLYNWRFKIFGEYPDLEKSLEEYRNHRKFVLEYFRNRPDKDFLVLDITDKSGFKKLANFLGKKTDRNEFPHFNKTQRV